MTEIASNESLAAGRPLARKFHIAAWRWPFHALELWKGGAVVMLLVACLFPLAGAVLVGVLALDMLLRRHVEPLKHALG